MGLPGSGKTTLASALQQRIWEGGRTCAWFNADKVREQFDDWDFSDAGRVRQSTRMKTLAENASTDYVICDFVAPTPEIREIFNADVTIWIDTIETGRFEDTNKAFAVPEKFDYQVITQDAEFWSEYIWRALKEA